MNLYASLKTGFCEIYATPDDARGKIRYSAQPADGFYPCNIVNEKPNVGDGEELVYHMKYADGRIEKEYLKHRVGEGLPPDMKGLRRWSRLGVKRALEKAGVWEAVRQMMQSSGVWETFLMCDWVSEEDPDFSAARDRACAQFGKAAVDALLDGVPVEA